MAEVFVNTPVSRSENMRAIRSRGTRSTEKRLRAAIVRRGLKGWCMHAKETEGVPDFLLPRERIVVFVDGCFWHGCPRCGHIPKTNVGYWRRKIERNKARDIHITAALRGTGFKVIRLWECEIRTDLGACVGQIEREIAARSGKPPAK